MTKQKDLKRIVRSRMQKTGESYTAARFQILDKKKIPRDLATTAGMSDAAVRAKTGRTWAEWADVLDSVGASEWPHGEIAKHLHDGFDLPGWWAQTVTVGYERIRGLRDVGQRRDGSYEANKTKTFAVPVEKLYRAFADARWRRRWLPDLAIAIRTSRKNTSMRIACDDGTAIDVYFTSKGGAKASVNVQHRKLPTKVVAERMKEYWGERLVALSAMLG